MGLLSAGGKSVMGKKSIISGPQTRSFASVGSNTPRQHPMPSRQRRTPVSFDTANLTIRNGPVFNGKSFGAKSNVSGEAVFTTSLVGYPESLTDPSYRGQILVFTQPLIGNYGVPSSARDENGLLKYFESPNIQAVGVVVADVANDYSHWTAVESLSAWCAREGVPAITGVDTRAIVTYLREQGSTLAKITIGEEYDEEQDEAFVDPEQINLVRKVSTKQPFHVSSSTGDMHVALIDCGVKENILRSLVSRGCSVTCFPFDYPLEKVVLCSCASGALRHCLGAPVPPNKWKKLTEGNMTDPTHCVDTVQSLRTLFQTSQLPIFGICLGHQLLALAAGARTTKLKYGNRAHNIPCLDLTTGRVHITSQNHGYAVDAQTLPSDFKEFFVNLNDSSNEGIIHKFKPIFSTQFHPESKGGPMDSNYLFDNYLVSVKRYKDSQAILQPNRENRPNPLLVDLLAKERVGVVPTLGMANMARAKAAHIADAEPEARAAAAA
ncbi:Multifunctional pyrimidine synthesis protein CAD [Imshaugia aleurites]|uniref:Carbamoyl phosphate synthase arginine-specific small chain n=1 Tax=Imshaugia aleurites TaxID=172621 RepID=A0A8H3FPK7_9LECA|nr:Multifunctional pyrimidine synthesis protein CAD [Imshaugia aleurites]